MNKLSLNAESLKVESFDTSLVAVVEAPVAAHALRTYPSPEYTCRYHCTWYPTVCG
jgi:hypothetical protein